MKDSDHSLPDLGFSAHFLSQLSLDELEQLRAVRVTEVQRDRITTLGERGHQGIPLTATFLTSDIAVGDWVLTDSAHRLVRILSPKTSLHRRAAGTHASVVDQKHIHRPISG